MQLYDASDKFPGFQYPSGLLKVVDLGLTDLDAWFILDAPFGGSYCESINDRYPDRKLIPFAKRTDTDDVACFEIDKPNEVQIIHDFADPGWEQREGYPDFWSWFLSAVEALVEQSRDEESDEL